MKLKNFSVIEKVEETRGSTIYRARKDNEDRTYIIKEFKSENPSVSEIARFRQEYNTISNIDIKGVIKIYEIIEYENKIALVIEDFQGLSLRDMIDEIKKDLVLFFKIAIKLSETLGYLHQKNIVHKDIKPKNILFNPETDELKLADFGIANEITHENNEIYNPHVIEGTLAYMSPEQTGRMNRQLDYRTDMYSLGITFYELLTGRPPFISNDPLELIHSHIAKKPPAPCLVDTSVPEAVSDIIVKLLSKTAEERYQNAFSLKSDLETCESLMGDYDKIHNFKPGLNDFTIMFSIPQILVGRKKDLAVLMKSFKNISTGARELLLVSGPPGIGKTSLINELYKVITERRGYFISGKYDQYRRDVPYSAVIQAFNGIIKEILFENDERIMGWKKDILEALGSNGRVMTDLIPDLEYIIGEQPEIPMLGSEESKNRFNYIFKQFAAVFFNEKHPIVIFLDDLQWADTASLEIIKILITDPDLKSALIIGAYRDNEVSAGHPMLKTIDDIRWEGVPVTSIIPGSLTRDEVADLVSYTFKTEKERSSELSEIIIQKTAGNPFFVHQFLKAVHDENIISFDPAKGWSWNTDAIREINVTDNVIDLMADRISKFDNEIRDILKLCACIGNRFELEMLSLIMERPISVILEGMQPVIKEGFFRIQGDTYRFQHDKIQEAAYLLSNDDERVRLHCKIGSLLLYKTPPDELDDKILFIIDHLNRGASCSDNTIDKKKLAELNLQAAVKSRSSNAYGSALNYLKNGIEYLGADAWINHYNLTLQFYYEAAESAFMNTSFDDMDLYINITLKNAKNVLDAIKVYEIRIQSYTAQNRLDDAIRTTINVLNLLGINIPKKVTMFNAAYNFLKMKLSLHRKNDFHLLNMHPMKNLQALAALNIATSGASAFYTSGKKEIIFIVFKMIELSIKNGNSLQTALWYAYYGLMLSSFKMIDDGYRFGNIALKLLENYDTKNIKTRVIDAVNCFIRPWKEHIRNTLPSFLEGYRIALERGDLEYVAWNTCHYSFYSFYSGEKLQKAESEILSYVSIALNTKQEGILYYNKILYQTVLNLQGRNLNPLDIIVDGHNEKELVEILLKSDERTGINLLYLNKMLLCYIFGEYDSSGENAAIARKYISGVAATYFFAMFYFLRSLHQLALYRKSSVKKRKKILKQTVLSQKRLKKWAHHAPMNYMHKYYLVEAEIARVKGKREKANARYEQAIRGAHENNYIHEEGMAYECAAKHYAEQGYGDIARAYMSCAYRCFEKWGAEAKLRQIESAHPDLVHKFTERNNYSFDTLSVSTTRRSDILDLSTVMKASQAISKEIQLKQLLGTMMTIVLENAGAERGFLIIEKDGSLVVEATKNVNDDAAEVLQSIPLTSSNDLSLAIVHYSARTHETVILDDAADEGDFTLDPYIIKIRPRSVLCIPMIIQGSMMGILYLENNQTPGAFTRERLELLKILSFQAAISINNARVYDKLERSEEKYRHIIDSANDIIYICDIQGKFIYVNKIGMELTGYSPDEMMKNSYLDFVLPEYRDMEIKEYGNQIRNKVEVTFHETPFRKKDGSVIWLNYTVKMLKNSAGEIEFHAIARDITDRKQAEDALKLKEEQYRAQLEEEIRERTRDLEQARFEAERANFHKSKFLANMSHELRTPLNSIIGIVELLRFGSYEKDEEVLQLVGELISDMREYDSNSALTSGVSAITDQLEEILKFIEADGNFKRYFFSRIRHQLSQMDILKNNNSIIRNLERINELADSEEKDILNAYRHIKDSGDYLLSLIDTILNLAKVESGKTEVKKTKVNLRNMIDSVRINADSYMKTKGKDSHITINSSVAEDVPLMIHCDEQKVRQVLLNLFSNAIKFTEKGSVSLHVALVQNTARFSISDTGMGISDDEKELLFFEFGRTRSVQQIEGSGLGLVISKKLVELQGGEMGFDSEHGRGSEFWFTLPLE